MSVMMKNGKKWQSIHWAFGKKGIWICAVFAADAVWIMSI